MMQQADTSERGLERLICTAVTGAPCGPGTSQTDVVREPGASYGGSGWFCGDPNDLEGKQAEFLVHDSFPWRLVEKIGVRDAKVAGQVTQIVANTAHRPPVCVEPGWYF